MVATGGYNKEIHTMGMMKMIDANGDHMVSTAEFTDYNGALFETLDVNKDGFVDAKEWVGTDGKKEISIATGGYATQLRSMKMMGAMDANSDHKVSKDEFITFQATIYAKMDKKGDGMVDAQNWLAKITGN
jgi:Ca2+-binding EF-hand superfamily protein